MDLRMFIGVSQRGRSESFRSLALRSDLLQVHRLGLIFTGIVGRFAAGGLLNLNPYNGSTLVGILLPLVFGEWLLTPPCY